MNLVENALILEESVKEDSEENRQQDWLDRHRIKKNEDGTYTLWHGTPIRSIKYINETGGLRHGSLLAESPDDAAFFAARDRGYKPKSIAVFEIRITPQQLQPGVFASLIGQAPLGRRLKPYEIWASEPKINETFETGFSYNRYGKNINCEIFRNPTPKEYNECWDEESNSIRAFLIGKNIIVWNTYTALHQEVREHLHLDQMAIPIIIYSLGQECLIQVTDNSKNTIWWHNPEVIKFIENHPFLRRKFSSIDEISFYDEDIYGKWDQLEN